MSKFFLIFLVFPTILVAQNNYYGTVSNQKKEILPFTKIYAKGKIFNTDANGIISGNLNIGDSLIFSKIEFKNNIHVVKSSKEEILLNEIYKEIPEISLDKKKYVNEFSIIKEKKRSYYSLRSDKIYSFKYKNDKNIVFNNIEIPIKFVSYVKGLISDEKTYFTLQFYTVENNLPKEPITDKIDFEINRKNKSKINISLQKKIIIPDKDFCLILEVNEKSKLVLDKKTYSFNPVFLCNDQGEEGSYLEYDVNKGEWESLDEKKRNAGFNDFNLIINLKMID